MIKDYSGNEIKEGQEICFITVVDIPVYKKIACLMAASDIAETWKEISQSREHCWKVGNYYEVQFNKFLGLYYVIESINSSFFVSLQTDTLLDKTDTNILAIKGVSDNEEMYLSSLLF